MKKILCLSLVAVLLVCSSFTDRTDVMNGDAIVLDGTVQKISFRGDLTMNKLLSSQNGVITLMIRVNGAGGCKIANQSTLTNTATTAQNATAFISIVPGRQDLYVQGTNTETLTVTY